MKITLITLIAIAFTFLQCSKDDSGVKEEKINMLTSGAWVPGSVINSEDGDLTSEYRDFTIIFLKTSDSLFDGDYYVSQGGRAFPESHGSWKFGSDLSALHFSDGREVELEVSNESLTLELNITPSGGRVKGLSGGFTFNLKH
jgi:hypothetical protein